MGFPALAITDHGNVGGIVKFIKECQSTKDKGDSIYAYPTIKPIVGSEFYLAKDRSAHSKAEQRDEKRGNYHLILLAKNWQGYQNLCTLSQKSYLEGFFYDPRIDIDLLSQYSDGLICSSACLKGIINYNLLYDRYDQAKKVCAIFKDIFKDDFFLEIMYHGIDAERMIIPDILKLSSELNIPVIATNDVHYVLKEHAKSHEVLSCMNSSKCILDPKRMHHSYDEFYLKSAVEMGMLFSDIPQVLTNTLAVAERVDDNDIVRNLFGGMKLPNYEIPDGFKDSFEYLSHLAWDGLKKINKDKSKPHIEALKKELNDIDIALKNNGYDFGTYFLIVEDIISFAKSKGILTGPGRGSGFASVLLRCLGATYGPDPLEYSLLWERFLGFANSRFIRAEDLGFSSNIIEKFDNSISIDDGRDLEEDQGGVDRY